jgi:hypothetical protein
MLTSSVTFNEDEMRLPVYLNKTEGGVEVYMKFLHIDGENTLRSDANGHFFLHLRPYDPSLRDGHECLVSGNFIDEVEEELKKQGHGNYKVDIKDFFVRTFTYFLYPKDHISPSYYTLDVFLGMARTAFKVPVVLIKDN